MFTIYLIGAVIWAFLLTMGAGYDNARGRDTIGFPTVLIVSMVWPISIPFLLGAYLGGK